MKDNAVDFRILEEPLLVTGLGIAFAKNDTRGLDSQLTDTLAQMRADGTLERIVGRYLEKCFAVSGGGHNWRVKTEPPRIKGYGQPI